MILFTIHNKSSGNDYLTHHKENARNGKEKVFNESEKVRL